MDLKVTELSNVSAATKAAPKERVMSDEFAFTLKRLGNEGLAERLNGLIGDITAQGKKIADHMDISDVRKYRSMISEFINEVVTNSHEFSRENFLDRRGRHRVYGIVKKINKDVDDLAQELLSQETDHLKVLELTGQISGLLMDLMI